HDLDQRVVDHLGHVEVDDGRVRIAHDVGGHERIVGDGDDAAVPVGVGLVPEGLVDLVGRGGTVGDEHDVGQRTDRDRGPHGDTVEASGQLGDGAGGGPGRSCGRGDEVGRS